MEALLDKAIQKPAEVVQDIVTLRNDVNRIHELNSKTARSLSRMEQVLAVSRDIQEAMQVARDTSTVQETLIDKNANTFEEDLEDQADGDEPHNIRCRNPRSQSRGESLNQTK